MDLNVLKTFVAVCEYSGFSSAGEKLGYTQSTVSSQIKQLERELNVTLFDRLYHKISVTQEGRCVLGYARDILALEEKLHGELHRPEKISGELRLAMSSSVCARYFGSDYIAFRKQYPSVKLKITEAGTDEMFNMLRKNETDLVFTLDNHIYDSDFEICAERKEKVHFVASKSNRLAFSKSLCLEQIKDEPFAATEKNMSYRRILDEKLAARSMMIAPILEIGNPMQLCSVVSQSDMIAFLPDFITDSYIASGKLVYLPVSDCEVDVWTQLLVHKSKWRSPALGALIDYYKEVITK